MPLPWTPLFFPILSFAFTWLGTYLTLSLLKQYQLLDMPNDRSNHKTPTPRGGGAPLVIAAGLLMMATGIHPFVLAAFFLLAFVSWMDDRRGLPVYVRLPVQAFAVALGLAALPIIALPFPLVPALMGIGFLGLLLKRPLQALGVALGFAILPIHNFFLPVMPALIGGFLWLWYVNLTNFMDGIDGITALETIAVTSGICFLRALHPDLPLALAEQASIVGAGAFAFYGFNRAPARLFLGDVGSVPLGFITFYLLITLALHGYALAALLLPGYYLSDATFTLLARFIGGEKIWQAHSKHAYQRAVRGGMSHARVTGEIALLNLGLVLLACFASIAPKPFALIAVFAGYALCFLLMHRFFHAHPVR
jgi:UDP-N-acetylmuramyl pentapeptide phosphotransferase/UDP-N-acetylglucosamine-1-phosphate transferase